MRTVPRSMQSLAAAWNSLNSFVLMWPCAVDGTLQSKNQLPHSFSLLLTCQCVLTVLILFLTCHIVFEAVLLQILVPWFVFCVVCCRLDSTDTMFHMSHCLPLSLKQYLCKYWCHGLSFVLSAVDLTVLLLCFTCYIVDHHLWSNTFANIGAMVRLLCYLLQTWQYYVLHVTSSADVFEAVLFPNTDAMVYLLCCML